MTPDQPRNRRSLLLVTAILIIFLALIYWLGGALLPLLISGVVAYALLPVVRKLEQVMPWRNRKPALARLLSVILIFLVLAGGLAGIGVAVVPPAIEQTSEFVRSIPVLAANIRTAAEQLNEAYANRIPLRIRESIREAITAAGNTLVEGVQDAALGTVRVVASALTLIIGLAAMPMMLFYMLKDRDSLAEGLQQTFPPTIRPQATAILRILNRTVGSYIRGQLILGLVVGTITAIGLFLLGVPFSILLGITAGFTELIPIVGPWIGGLVGVLVVLASAPEKLPWVILFYLGVQLVENTLLVPRIQGQALGLHPIVVLVVIVVGSQLMGLWGIILGPPLAAAAKEVIRYFYHEWNRPLLYTATGPLTPAPEPGPQDSAAEETAPTTRRE